MSSTASAPSFLELTPKLERAVYVVGGTILLTSVLRRRSPWRWGAAAAGGALIYNGVTGAISVSDHLLAPGSAIAPIKLRQTITIGKNAIELSSMWHSTDVMERLMRPFGQIEILGSDHLRWSASALGTKFEVECTLAEEQPGELVRWESIPNSRFKVEERMRFRAAPQGRGTEATLEYDIDLSKVPAGVALRRVTSFFEGPARMAIRKVLHDFKSLAETGEIATLERNSSARADGKPNGDLI